MAEPFTLRGVVPHRNPSDELADAIELLRIATTAREHAISGTDEYEDALTTEMLLDDLVRELLWERNRPGRRRPLIASN